MLIGNLSSTVVLRYLQILSKYHPIVIDAARYDDTHPVPDLDLQPTTILRMVGSGVRTYSLLELFSAVNPFSRANELVAVFLTSEKFGDFTNEIFGTRLPVPPMPICSDSILHAELDAFFAVLSIMDWVKCSPPYTQDTAVTLGCVKMSLGEWLQPAEPFLKMMYVLQLSDRVRYAKLAENLRFSLPAKLPWDTNLCEILHYATVFDQFLRGQGLPPCTNVKNIFDHKTSFNIGCRGFCIISNWTDCTPRFNRLNMVAASYLESKDLQQKFDHFQQLLLNTSYYTVEDTPTFGPSHIPVGALRTYLAALPVSVIIDDLSCSKFMISVARFHPQTKLGFPGRTVATWLADGFDNMMAIDRAMLTRSQRMQFAIELLTSPHRSYFSAVKKHLTEEEKTTLLTSLGEEKREEKKEGPKEAQTSPIEVSNNCTLPTEVKPGSSSEDKTKYIEPDWPTLPARILSKDYSLDDLSKTLDTLEPVHLDRVLEHIVTCGWYEAIPLVIANGANVNHQNWYGDTPLHIAVMRGYFDTSTMLLEHGANPNLTNHRNDSPLHCAARLNSQKMTELLLSKGADPTIRDLFGTFPRDLSAKPELLDKHTKPIEIIVRRKVMPADFANIPADSFVRTAELDQAMLSSLESKMTKK